jgi:putative hydrolase of the HAD superfamily
VNSVRVVCFDLGGVLVRIYRTWPDVCRAAGLEDRGGSATPAHDAARRELTELFITGRLTPEEWAGRLFAALDGLYSPADLARIHDAWIVDEYDGAGAVVDDVHRAGLITACLSNTNHTHWVRMLPSAGGGAPPGKDEFPAVSRLRRHFASHILGLAKPDPAIYRAFEQAMDCSGAEILFFDDLPENIAAARALGWQAEPIDPQSQTAPQLRALLRRHGVL